MANIFKFNKSNATRLSKGRIVSSEAIANIDFEKNKIKLDNYLKAKQSYYMAHDDMIMLLYRILAKYENQGFSSQDFLKMMNYSKVGTTTEDWNLATLLSNIGRLNIRSEQFSDYMMALLKDSNITQEDAVQIFDALKKYDEAYEKYRTLDIQNYKDQKQNAQFLRSETKKFQQLSQGNLKEKMLYAITTAEKDLSTKTTLSNVYLLESNAMNELLDNEMYFGVYNTVNKLGLLTYTRFGAKEGFSTEELKTIFPEQISKGSGVKSFFKDFFNENVEEGQYQMQQAIQERYGYIQSQKKNIYGRAAEAGLRGMFLNNNSIQRGENELGLKEGDIVISRNGTEYHISVKNIRNFGAQSYDEFKERAPEDMAYMFSNKKIFIQYYGDSLSKSSLSNSENISEQEQSNVSTFIENDPEIVEQLYDQSGLEQEIVEILSGI